MATSEQSKEISWLRNELRIASCLAKLKREQADRAEERERDVAKKLETALAKAGAAEETRESVLDVAQEAADSYHRTMRFLGRE